MPEILCIVDRAGWAHDRKTDALAVALAGTCRIVKRYQADVTIDEMERADLVLLYYWFQIERLGERAATLHRRRDRVLLGICSEFELAGDFARPGLEILRALPCRVFANNLTLARRTAPLLGRPVAYTPNGVDTTFFRPAPSSNASSSHLRVGWAGSLTNQGGAHRGVDAFIAPAVAAVGGELRIAAREERWRSAEEMREFYRGLDVYVCASESEGTPNPCLEAAACGVPVVSTRVGCMPEFLRDGENGFLVDRDPTAIARRLAALRDDPMQRQRLARAGRATAEALDWHHLATNYAILFASALAAVPAPGPEPS